MGFKKVFERTSRSGTKDEVYYNSKTGQTKYHHSSDIGEHLEVPKRERKEARGKNRYFDSRISDGDRVIARVPKVVISAHPEVFGKDAEPGAILKWLDTHEEYKTLPVGWTHVKNKKSLKSEKFRKNFGKAFNG